MLCSDDEKCLLFLLHWALSQINYFNWIKDIFCLLGLCFESHTFSALNADVLDSVPWCLTHTPKKCHSMNFLFSLIFLILVNLTCCVKLIELVMMSRSYYLLYLYTYERMHKYDKRIEYFFNDRYVVRSVCCAMTQIKLLAIACHCLPLPSAWHSTNVLKLKIYYNESRIILNYCLIIYPSIT